jgi:hypothetical protein
MERPGLLEFAVYAMVLTVSGAWVYGLPPFDYESRDRIHFAHVEPTSAGLASEEQRETTIEFAPIDIGPPITTESATAPATAPATARDADEQPRTDPPPNVLVVTAGSLNMRAQPDARSAVVGTYPSGTRVQQVEVSGNWIRVRTEDEATGWMYSAYLGEPHD